MLPKALAVTRLYELELRRDGLPDEERLYDGEPLAKDELIAIEDGVWRVMEEWPSLRPEAYGRLILKWEGWRRNEAARHQATVLAEQTTALQNEARLILKRVRFDRDQRARQ